MDFAPYQDQSPETVRTLSPPPPPPQGGRRSRSFSPNQRPNAVNHIGAAAGSPPDHRHGEMSGVARNANVCDGGDFEDTRAHVSQFETSLPLRLDHEAMLAYLLLPPAGGVFLLLIEHKSDYVRFHAWQSSLLFTAVFVLHVILAWTRILSWILLVGDLILIGWLTMHAYQDANTLDRYEVPLFGPLASSFVDEE